MFLLLDQCPTIRPAVLEKVFAFLPLLLCTTYYYNNNATYSKFIVLAFAHNVYKEQRKVTIYILGIQIRKSKIYLNEVALRIGCKNMFWSQCFNQKLSGWTTLGPAIVVLAALVSRAACTIMAVPKVVQPVRLIKFWLKHCDQGTFLHWILSATSCK